MIRQKPDAQKPDVLVIHTGGSNINFKGITNLNVKRIAEDKYWKDICKFWQ